MQNRLRSAVTGLTSQAKRLIPGRDDPVIVTDVDDDPEAEDLAPAASAPEDAELAALDEGDAPPINLADGWPPGPTTTSWTTGACAVSPI